MMDAPAFGQPRQIALETVVFVALLLLTCAWILALPVFPTQDGPVHKYYVQILGELVHGTHEAIASSYQVRHPFPPYASHYFLLLFLSRIMDNDLAEKLFVCLVVCCTALGVRFTASHLGGGGRWVSLFVFPLLLHWPLMMGFMNYSLGIGLLLLCFGFWLRAVDGQGLCWIGFVALSCVITVTHPVALLVLLLLCCLDTATLLFGRIRLCTTLPDRTHLAARLLATLLICVELLFPAITADQTRTGSDLTHSMFRFKAYLTDLTLAGLSPYARHTSDPIVCIYRAVLYAILIGGVVLASRGLKQRWQARATTRTDAFLLATVALYLALPMLPDTINGSASAATRMFVFVWFGAIFASSSFNFTQTAQQQMVAGAVAAWCLTLLPAQTFLYPKALMMARLEHEPFPERQHGLLLRAEGAEVIRANSQLAIDTNWSGLLPMMRRQDVLINSPWLDLTVSPLQVGIDPLMMINEMPNLYYKQVIDQYDFDLSFLPLEVQNKVLAGAGFIFVQGGKLGERGEISTLSPEQSGKFHCSAYDENLLCLRDSSAR